MIAPFGCVISHGLDGTEVSNEESEGETADIGRRGQSLLSKIFMGQRLLSMLVLFGCVSMQVVHGADGVAGCD